MPQERGRAPRACLTAAACWMALWPVAACSGAGTPRELSIAAGESGSGHHAWGRAIAALVGEHLAGVDAAAEETGGPTATLERIGEGRADLAVTQADMLADAVGGRGQFEGRPIPAATLAVLPAQALHLVTLAQAGISAVGDLRGRTVSSGPPGSGTETVAVRVLRAAGLDPDRDVTRRRLLVREAVEAIRRDTVSAFFWIGGPPVGAIQDLAHTPATAIRLIPTADLLAALPDAYRSAYIALEIPASAYRGMDGPVQAIGVPDVLVAHPSMPDALAYDITRLLLERPGDLAAADAGLRILPGAAAARSPAAFHPGAVRFYRERGLWTD